MLQQNRQKWNKPQRNLEVGDIVIIKDETTPRCDWPLAIVRETEKDKSGFVRAVKVKTQHSVLRRPVCKLVLVVSAN